MSFLLFFSVLAGVPVSGTLVPRLENGLALTPPLGWNSYNHYSCSPNETIVRSNAQALVDLGLKDLGYHFVTVDCGWTLPDRSADGTLQWNPDRFPQGGGKELGDYLHGLGLGFGVYSDAGIKMCMNGEPEQAGTHEQTDALTFASWGADLLKYDNCYSEASSGYPNVDYAPTVPPSDRYANMSAAVAATNRSIIFQICDWGVDFPSAWAPDLGNSWRITNDIIPANSTKFCMIYGHTTSASYTGTLTFTASPKAADITVNGASYTLPAETTSLSFPLSLTAFNNNTISLSSASPPKSLVITLPESTLYAASLFTPSSSARLANCNTGLCAPVGSKLTLLSPTGLGTLNVKTPPAAVGGNKYVNVLFANNDIAFATAWDFGTNTRNLTISVNSIVTRIEVPLSGKSSELFAPGGGWEDTGVFGVLLPGWKGGEGENVVVVGNQGAEGALVEWGPDFIGLEVWW
ncbi:alpha-galactosidase D [Diplocarpon rosae]|nr:alpha-galactosidase D [Diplocarpon rosae]